MNPITSELVRICRYFTAFERGAVCCGTVTVPQCLVMQELLGGARDLGSLAAFAGTSASAMTRLVDGLERKGWVERRRDAEDRRRVVIALTADGAAEATRLQRLTDVAVEAVLRFIPEADRPDVLRVMTLVRAAMAQAGGELTRCC